MQTEEMVAQLVTLAENNAVDEARDLLATSLDVSDANPVIEGMKAAADRNWYVLPVVAQRLGALVQYAAEVLADLYRAYGQMMEADGLRFQGYSIEALPLFDAAAATYEHYHRPVMWARTRIGYIVALSTLGRYDEALEIAEKARAVFIGHGEWSRAGTIELNLATIFKWQGDIRQALITAQNALVTFQKSALPNESMMAGVIANTAIYAGDLGDLVNAEERYVQARTIYEKLDLPIAVAVVNQNIGELALARADYATALAHFRQAYGVFIDNGMIENAAISNQAIVESLIALNRIGEGVSLATDVIAVFERLDAKLFLGTAFVSLAQVQARTSQIHQALLTLGRARTIFENIGAPRRVALIDVNTAALLLASGQIEKAVDAVERAQRSTRAQDHVTLIDEANLLAARVVLAQEKFADAITFAQEVLESTAYTRERAYQASLIIARAADAQGDSATAYRWYDTALDQLEGIGARLPMELRVNFLDDVRLDAYQYAIRHSLAHNDAARAFRIAERSRSRALLDYMTNDIDIGFDGQSDEAQTLRAELRRVQAEYAWFARKVVARQWADEADDGGVDPIQECRVRETQIAELLARLQYLGLAGHTEAQTIPTQTPQEAIPPGVALLSYVFDDDDLIIFRLDRRSISAQRVPGARPLIERAVISFESGIGRARAGRVTSAAVGQIQTVLSRLYDIVIAPIEAALADCSHLIIVPTQILHSLPFNALWDGSRYVVERWSVSTLPAAALLPHLLSRPDVATADVLVMGYAPGDSLPFVTAEANAVAGLFGVPARIAENATRHVLYDQAENCRIVHLAAHGEFRPDAPLFSALHFADGPLTALDVMGLRLNADLVTLSACNTGRAAVSRADELTGLSRAFLYAGARALVLSLWSVEDTATATLMRTFYTALLGGASRADALRSAQCALIGSDTAAHPFFWAAFQLVGDWRAIGALQLMSEQKEALHV